jgi:excisionase family DNA binding protein
MDIGPNAFRGADDVPFIIDPAKRLPADAVIEVRWRIKGAKRTRRPPQRSSEGLLTIKQAAAALGCSERTLGGHVREGSIRYVDVGRGKQRRALRFAPEDIEAFKAQHRGTSCRSPSEAKSGTSSLSTEVVDFAALRAALRGGRPKPSSAPSGKRRRRKRNVVKL